MKIEEILAAYDANIARAKALKESLLSAKEALQKLSEEMLVPLAEGVLLKARPEREVLIDVGGGVYLKENVDEAIARIERRIKRVEEEIKRLEEERNKIIEKVKAEYESSQ